MNHRRPVGRATCTVAAVLAAAAPALAADSLSDSVEQFLNNTESTIHETKLWKFEMRPSLRESVIWTDNIFLNDDNEKTVTLNAIIDTNNPSNPIDTNPAHLAHAEATLPQFKDRNTQGRESDFIIQS